MLPGPQMALCLKFVRCGASLPKATHLDGRASTVQYLAGHENSKVTMDIYAKAKYNRPAELSEVVNGALMPHSDSDES